MTTTLARPQDDFFRHVNGDFLASTLIEADRASAGSFIQLDDGAQQAVRSIIDDLAADPTNLVDPAAAGDPAGWDEAAKVAALYQSFMDTMAVEAAGTAPLTELLARVDAITSTTELARHWGWSARHGVGSLVGLFSDFDLGDPSRYALFCSQSGLGLPDRDYYLSEGHAELRERYLAHLERMLGLAGVDDPAGQARLVLDLETRIAGCHWDRVRNRDITQRHNPMGWQDFFALAPALQLAELLEGAQLSPQALGEPMNVDQPSFLREVAELVTAAELPAWRAWARWKLVHSLAAYLNLEIATADFDFYGGVLNGLERNRERWQRGVALVEQAMGEALGKLYVERHFPAEAKQRMDSLVANLLAVYGESIARLDWMGEQTRAEALQKLAGFLPKIGYPSRWQDYQGLVVDADDLVGNVLRAGAHRFDHDMARHGGPVDRDEWLMLPQQVNAYYHPVRNEIVFPAAILQPPFFDPQASDALNYGGIGAVIGHEIGHGFDDQGSRCDGEGRLRNWWTDEDREAFAERTASLVEQYDALVPLQFADEDPAPHVNGRLTIGENIGDLGGLGIAVKAYRISRGGEVSDEELRQLFTGYATIWCTKMRDEALRRRLDTDPHSPAEFRCNQILANLDDFHRVFDVQPGDGMWLEPEQRVSIW